MGKIKLRPCKGYSVRKPDGKQLMKAGEEVEQSTFWMRRVQFGEVELCSEVEKTKEAPKKIEEKKEEIKEVKKDKKQKSKGGK